jgi:glycerol-3-phosphate dehydrogenase
MAVGLRNNFKRKSRLYFVTPWRGKSIIGTAWFANDTPPDELIADESQCLNLIDGFNAAYQTANLTLDDVVHVHAGLVPCKEEDANGQQRINLLNHFRIINHANEGLDRVISIAGVKYTTAADVAEKTLKYLFPRIKMPSVSSQPQLVGGEIEDFSSFKTELMKRGKSNDIREDDLIPLVYNYGSETEKILKLTQANNQTNSKFIPPYNNILKSEILLSLKEEMAQKLSDVVLRRTELGTAGCPSESSLKEASVIMAEELNWDETKRKSEINELRDFYPPFLSPRNLEMQGPPERLFHFQNCLQ